MKPRGIFLKTIFEHRSFVFIWTIATTALGILYTAVYSSVIAQNQQFTDAIKNLPSVVGSLVGGLDTISTPAGFIQAEIFALTGPAIITIVAVVLGSSLINKEETSGTLELLLSRPISRTRVVAEKVLAMLLLGAIIICGYGLGIAIGTTFTNFSINAGHLALAFVFLYALGMSLGLLSLMITTLKPHRAPAAGIPAVVFILSNLVSNFAPQIHFFDKIKFLSLFHYYRPKSVLDGHAELAALSVLIGFSFVCFVLAQLFFTRRDIRS